MPLKFNCDRCGREIVVKYLRKGEVAKCRACGIEMLVPESAVETGEEPSLLKHIRESRDEPAGEEKADENPFPLAPFSSGRPRSRILILFVVIAILLAAASIGSTYSQIRLVHKVEKEGGVTLQEAEANWTRQEGIFLLKIGLLVAISLLLMVWIHRVYKNLPALGVRGLRLTPWRAAVARGGVSFIQPYRVIKEIWKASDPEVDLADGLSWKESSLWGGITWWWFLWVTVIPLNLAAFLISFEAQTLGEMLGSSWVVVISEIPFILTYNLLARVVQRIDSRQERKYQKLKQLGISPSQRYSE
jgi:DNA-directed RNA polymerase subunit RPC12/RpoP